MRLSYAASLARTFGASIICVHVIEPMVPTVGYSGMTEPLPIADITDSWKTRLNANCQKSPNVKSVRDWKSRN